MKLYALLLVVAFAACAHVQAPRAWQPEEIVGYRLSEKSGAISFRFTDAGSVTAVLSVTDERGNISDAGLILSWAIGSDGTLLLSDSEQRRFATLKIIGVRKDHYTIQMDGVVREFSRQKDLEYYGWRKRA